MSQSDADIKQILGEEAAQAILKEFNVADAPAEWQTKFLSDLGQNLMLRIVHDILAILPEEKRAGFDEVLSAGDPEAVRTFLTPYIPDFDTFVAQTARKEVDETKAVKV